MLHITKVAVGCPSLDYLADLMASHAPGPVRTVTTRYRPTRHVEIVGGSLYWILKHRLIGRQTILGFEAMADEKRWIILLDARLIPVHPVPRRAHQGWRYLTEKDAPADYDLGDAGLAALPRHVREELAALALL